VARDIARRYGIGSPDGQRSAVWKFWTYKDDVYATHRVPNGVEKFSFHASGDWRRAIVAERIPAGVSDRVLNRWRRSPPEHPGSGRATVALTVVFPWHQISPTSVPLDSAVQWIAPAPAGRARVLQIIFAFEAEALFRDHFAKQDGGALLGIHRLPRGETVAFGSYTCCWEEGDMIAEAYGDDTDIVFQGNANISGDRLVHMTIYNTPSDGDSMFCWEFAGFRVPKGQARLKYPHASTLSRQAVRYKLKF